MELSAYLNMHDNWITFIWNKLCVLDTVSVTALTNLETKLATTLHCSFPSILLATVPYLEPAGFIGLHGNGLATSKIDDFLPELPN